MSVRVAKKIRRLLGVSRPYQSKRVIGTEQRWNLIRSNLGSEDRNLLDVGCNVGMIAARAARGGCLALGVERDPRLVRRARRLHGAAPNLAFMRLELDPGTIRLLPEVDVILCLSVHHHWARQYGLEKSWEMVSALLHRSRRKLFFEPASVRRKYAGNSPGFLDLDRESIIDRVLFDLSVVASEGQVVRCLGETPCVGREPFRLLFLVERV